MNISCKCSQIVFAVQRSDLLCRRLPQIYALHPILFYQRILGKIHLRPNLSNILIYLLITNALQHSTTTFFTTTAGKVTQDHELAITPHIEIGLHNTPPPPLACLSASGGGTKTHVLQVLGHSQYTASR